MVDLHTKKMNVFFIFGKDAGCKAVWVVFVKGFMVTHVTNCQVVRSIVVRDLVAFCSIRHQITNVLYYDIYQVKVNTIGLHYYQL